MKRLVEALRDRFQRFVQNVKSQKSREQDYQRNRRRFSRHRTRFRSNENTFVSEQTRASYQRNRRDFRKESHDNRKNSEFDRLFRVCQSNRRVRTSISATIVQRVKFQAENLSSFD